MQISDEKLLLELIDTVRGFGTDEEYARQKAAVLARMQHAALSLPVQPVAWRCFHCDEVFTEEHAARCHFGRDEGCTPACQIKASEGSLVAALRRAENDANEAWQSIHNETTDAAKAYHAQHARHIEQLRLVEETAYEKGLADGRALTNPVPPTKGPEDDLIAAREVIDWIDAWISNPVGSYSTMALDGLFAMTRDRILALRSRPASALPVVKPLEWRYYADAFPPMWVSQNAAFGSYSIEEASGSDSPTYDVLNPTMGLMVNVDSLPDAKAAAQADYERRILSALTTTVQP